MNCIVFGSLRVVQKKKGKEKSYITHRAAAISRLHSNIKWPHAQGNESQSSFWICFECCWGCFYRSAWCALKRQMRIQKSQSRRIQIQKHRRAYVDSTADTLQAIATHIKYARSTESQTCGRIYSWMLKIGRTLHIANAWIFRRSVFGIFFVAELLSSAQFCHLHGVTSANLSMVRIREFTIS